jgi:hypothetical protein
MSREDSIRKEILFQLYALRPLALGAERIARDAGKNDYDYRVSEIKRELVFMEDKGLVILIPDAVGTASLYRIHALGVTYYEQHYAA